MLRVEPLSRLHDRKSFDCGQPALNDYLQKTALQHIEKGISRTFVLIDTDRTQNSNLYQPLVQNHRFFTHQGLGRAHGLKIMALALPPPRK